MKSIEEIEKNFKKEVGKSELMLMKHKPDPFIEHRTSLHDYLGGIQKEYQFDNGYGASVICHAGSYGGKNGRWELAVLLHGILCYDTAITHDVLGHLTTKQVNEQLKAIKEL